MTSERHERSESDDQLDAHQWTRYEGIRKEVLPALELPENLESAEAILRTCLLTLAETDNQDLKLTPKQILETVLQCVGPGRRIPLDSELLNKTLTEGIGTGIPAEDGPCQEFRVDGTWYRFVNRDYVRGKGVVLEGTVDSESDVWSFQAECTNQARFRGSGESRKAATDDWRYHVHSRFQQLAGVRPFQMSEDDEADWNELTELIDVEHYWRTTPLRHRRRGRIQAVRSGERDIAWDGVEEEETIRIDDTWREFASYEKGQWFEALVERSRDSFALQKIADCHVITPVEEMSEQNTEI